MARVLVSMPAKPLTLAEANAAELQHIPERIAAAQFAGDDIEKARLELRRATLLNRARSGRVTNEGMQ